MSKRVRQYIGVLAAVVAYYLIHEGAHLIRALFCGTFDKISFMGLGVQIAVFSDRMSDTQLFVFCLCGAAATLCAGYLLAALAKNICRVRKKLFRAVMYYITIAMLVIDPLYLSALCGLFGGGDMNGILLFCPEWLARSLFGVLLIVNVSIFFKWLLPVYRASFAERKA